MEAAKPERRQLSADEQTRLNKLKNILEQMRRGENVQNRQLQPWLLEDEYAELGLAWQEQQELRLEMADKPSDLVKYEEKVKQAIFNYNRAEGYSSKGKHNAAKRFYNSSETSCEEALEILQEIVHPNPYLQTWFDRELNFSADDGLSADVSSLPRLVTSRSHERQRTDGRIFSKQAVKLTVVERAIDRIGRG
jgi:hypothetical protein